MPYRDYVFPYSLLRNKENMLKREYVKKRDYGLVEGSRIESFCFEVPVFPTKNR